MSATMSTSKNRRHWRRSVPALVLALVTLTAACGSEDNGADGGSPSTGASDGVLGPAKPATGTPITLGYISTGRTSTIDSTADIKAAEAAAKYVNEHLGGIGGHPITLQVCEVTLDPAKASDCANQLVSAKVPAVLAGSTVNGVDQVVKVLTAAKVPLIADVLSPASALQTPGVYVLANALASFGAPAVYAKREKIDRVALIGLGVPGVVAPAENPGRGFYTKAGATLDIVAVPPGTADMTPQLQIAEGKKPGLFHIIGDPNFCLTALKGIQSLGLKAKITMIPNCISTANAASLPNGFDGIKVVLTAVLEGREFDQFKAGMALVSDLPADGRSVGGWQAVLAFQRAMEASKVSDLTSTNIEQGLKAMPATEFPMGGGETFQCNGKASAVSPNICASFSVLATADKGGTLSDFQPLAGDGIY